VTFAALDVELANEDLSSICSIGVAVLDDDGVVIDERYQVINPRTWFSPICTSIHGIQDDDVRHAPPFPDVLPQIVGLIGDRVVAHHGPCDRVAFGRACAVAGVPEPRFQWLDTTKVARRVWPDVARRGYGLKPLAQKIGHSFEHHHALEDAKACGQILVAALREAGLDLSSVLALVSRPITDGAAAQIAREGNPDGALFGETIVFTGALSIPRREAAALAAGLGCTVEAGVTKRTTLLVVGDQDVVRLAGFEKSSKHRKAEEFIAAGQAIRILRETDFATLGRE
jgi:DNA polymerase III subunit epsilon